jgi:hypothetical protein
MLQNSMAVFVSVQKLGGILFVCCLLFALSLVGLYLVHGQLDAVIDSVDREVTNRDAFVLGHRRYNQLTTLQWLSGTTYLLITAWAWRKVDSNRCRG